ncbi:MAG: alpha/beta fold hydrolase [Anaerolineae bacterium]
MKRGLFLFVLLTWLGLACSLTSTPTPSVEIPPTATATRPEVQNEATATPETAPAVLLFTIGMHIEPLGETAQGYRSGQADYHNPQVFQHHVEDILAVANIVEAHGGRMTIQAQSPFTVIAIESGNTVLKDLAARGHEMALHFHEDAHLGRDSSARPVQEWCEVMKEEIGYLTQASGVTDIRYWSGGNLYPKVFEAAACAELNVNSDWKNPQTQTTDLVLVGVNPWRPAGGTDGRDFSLFARHDPNGAIIFLPEGLYDRPNFASMRGAPATGSDEAYFEYLASQLYASLEAAQPDRVNVFHFTVHPAEFRGDPQDPFGVIEDFLTQVVDPLVASGQVQWATFSQMADAYIAWEAAHPGEAPRTAAPPTPVATPTPALSQGGRPCGDGVCQGPENAQNCPADCALTPGPTSVGEGEQYTVINPISGAALKVYVTRPPQSGGAPLPALVLVPGGSGDSRSFRKPRGEAQAFAQAGYVVVVFDPDGRGQSGGKEDYNGFIHQDGLAEIIRFAATLPGVDASRIGLVTYSFGITMGAGALARHPDLPVAFLLDWEGPANRNDTGGCDGTGMGHLQQVASCSDETFWAQREASTFIGQIRVPYQRIQSEQDHVQPDNTHAILMVNNAVNGGVPWVRLNDLPPNQTYDPANPPAMLTEEQERLLPKLMLQYIAELFNLRM